MHSLVILCTGDLILDVPDPDHWLSGIAEATRAADLTIGHLEVPHTRRCRESGQDVPAPAADPAHLQALQHAGFDAVTLAGNHIADCGAEGIEDTIAELDRLDIAHCGAGMRLREARRPAILRVEGCRVALLSYNCVGPVSSWATEDRAGCAYVRVEAEGGGPITPASALHALDPNSLAQLAVDITEARHSADYVLVALHKGIVHTPARLAPYERPLAHAAIEAGADVVLGHHAHILRGIEFYQGRPIYHGLGNGCVVTRALTPDQSHPRRAEWGRRRRELFGFEPDPAYPLAPFHPEAVNALMARLCIRNDGSLEVGFVPVYVEPPGRPILAAAEQARSIGEYVAAITELAGLDPLRLEASGEGIRVVA